MPRACRRPPPVQTAREPLFSFPLLTGAAEYAILNPVFFDTVGYRSGQPGQTVNLLANAFLGSNPSPTTIFQPLGFQGVISFFRPPRKSTSNPRIGASPRRFGTPAPRLRNSKKRKQFFMLPRCLFTHAHCTPPHSCFRYWESRSFGGKILSI